MDLTPQDVPRWRREIAEWTKEKATEWYELMIKIGRQPVRPAAPDHIAAAWLATEEHRRLKNASLRFFSADTCDVVNSAHRTMPPFAPVETDLPTKCGFVMFEHPICTRPSDGDIAAARDMIADHEVSEYPDQVKIIAASWSPTSLVSHDKRCRAGAVWISFYAESNLDDMIDDPMMLAQVRSNHPKLIVDTESVVAWCPPGADRDDYVLPPADSVTLGWERVLFAAFRIARQRALCDEDVERTERAERRRTARAELSPQDVTVVRLRHRTPSVGSGTGRKHTHQYPVSGHWRRQWYPSLQDNRPIWIDQHIRGPEGTELHHTERITIL